MSVIRVNPERCEGSMVVTIVNEVGASFIQFETMYDFVTICLTDDQLEIVLAEVAQEIG
jgi:hypothetical protein